jgi:hypothetical protein
MEARTGSAVASSTSVSRISWSGVAVDVPQRGIMHDGTAIRCGLRGGCYGTIVKPGHLRDHERVEFSTGKRSRSGLVAVAGAPGSCSTRPAAHVVELGQLASSPVQTASEPGREASRSRTTPPQSSFTCAALPKWDPLRLSELGRILGQAPR